MPRRSRPQYRSGLGWILGVAFEDTLTRPVRLAQGFTCVRCCGTPRASSPHDLTAPALASHDGRDCVQLPPARGCYHLAPRRTFTSNPVPMPGTRRVGAKDYSFALLQNRTCGPRIRLFGLIFQKSSVSWSETCGGGRSSHIAFSEALRPAKHAG